MQMYKVQMKNNISPLGEDDVHNLLIALWTIGLSVLVLLGCYFTFND